MATAATMAAAARHQMTSPSADATDVPTSTGTMAAGSVVGPAPATHPWLACLPLSHVGALAVVMRSLVTQTGVIVHDGFDPAAVMASGATLTALVPTAMQRIDAGCFRLILLGGTSLPPVVPPNAVTTYGMTETGSGVVY